MIDTMYKLDNRWEPTVQRKSVLWGELNGKENQKNVDICIWIAGSLCCPVEANTTL